MTYFLQWRHFALKTLKKPKTIAEGGKKCKSLMLPQTFLNYVLQWCLTGDQGSFRIYFWKSYLKFWKNSRLKQQSKKNKKDVTTNISKNFTKMFDHQFHITKENN